MAINKKPRDWAHLHNSGKSIRWIRWNFREMRRCISFFVNEAADALLTRLTLLTRKNEKVGVAPASGWKRQDERLKDDPINFNRIAKAIQLREILWDSFGEMLPNPAEMQGAGPLMGRRIDRSRDDVAAADDVDDA